MFRNRRDAAEKLAGALEKYKNDKGAVVFAIPRGGVVIADVICDRLNLPMDIVVARKIGAPFNEELAIGAVGPTGSVIVDERAVKMFNVSSDYIEREARRKMEEINRRLKKYRGKAEYHSLAGKKALLVDDGIATGYTVRAAVKFLKDLGAEKIILASPVIAPDTLAELEPQVNEVVYLCSEEPFFAVGQFYEEFPQVSDEEVMKIFPVLREK
ncbi:phosphoribosyltransferase [Thermoanaerobacterium sp. DL9XJH110]|uniref:phosphoribosyltransferase n=1 Tax=Thermoanaerobacterium sp. DL9XJH110 TaxID=3386643 RepID=UPI003BB6660A